MRIIISQPRYLPFVPYIQRIAQSDLFVFLDDVQRQSRGFENRNKILTASGPKWLTIPISSSSRSKIVDTHISGTDWIVLHKQLIVTNYHKHRFFDEKALDFFYQNLPLMGNDTGFVPNIVQIIRNICAYFEVSGDFVFSSSLPIDHNKIGPSHLAEIAQAVSATEYVSGGNGKAYGIEDAFKNICPVRFHFPVFHPYKQHCEDFLPFLAFLDELFCSGKSAIEKQIFSNLCLQ